MHRSLNPRCDYGKATLTEHGLVWGGFNVMRKREPLIVTGDARLAFTKMKERTDLLILQILKRSRGEQNAAFR